MAVGKLSSPAQQKLKEAIAARESGGAGDLRAVNDLNYIGRYQFGAAALEDTGYLKPNASKGGNKSIYNQTNWTGKDNVTSVDKFLTNEAAQENAMDSLLSLNYQRGAKLGVINADTSPEVLGGFLSAAHLGGAGNAANFFKNGATFRDAFGTNIAEYAKIGSTAVRSAQQSLSNLVAPPPTSAALDLVDPRTPEQIVEDEANLIDPPPLVPRTVNSDDSGVMRIGVRGGEDLGCKDSRLASSQLAYDRNECPEPDVFEVPFSPTPNRFKAFNTMTYSVSLYILGQEEYKRMMATGKKSVKDLVLFMQSGGISNTPGDEYNFGAKRSKHFPQDFYIDNLQLKGLVSGTATNAAHNVFEMNFTVTEPAGLTFLERLQAMIHDYQQELAQKRGMPFESNQVNYAAQTYLAVIRFYGYDKEGNQISGKDLETGETLSDSVAIAEKFIPFMFTNITFRLSSDKVEYSCTTVCPNSMTPLDFTHARIPFNASFQGNTVKDILVGKSATNGNAVQGLTEMLNEHQKKLAKDNKYEHHDIYEIHFENDIGLDTATVMQPGSTRAERTGFASIDNATESLLNDRLQKKLRNYEVRSGMSIVQFIDLVLRTSSYITEQYEQPIDENTGEPMVGNSKSKYLKWYKINTEVELLDFDKIRNDYAYKIKYVITRYKVDSVSSPYFSQFNKECFGIHKEYNFWFTGLNTEVLNFHQDYNYLWYTSIAVKTDPKIMEKNMNNLRSVQRRFFETNSIMNDQGGENKSAEGAANAASELYSPGDQATARFEIVGDPDFICQSEIFYGPLQRLNSPSPHAPFMPDGSVNYDSSEVFFTINYNTVVDYDLSTGLADVNQNNLGRDLTTGKPGLSKHSFVYRANVVTSQFEGGKFTQVLEGTMMFVPPECLVAIKSESVTNREDDASNTTAELSGKLNNPALKVDSLSESDTRLKYPSDATDLTDLTATNTNITMSNDLVINNGIASDTPRLTKANNDSLTVPTAYTPTAQDKASATELLQQASQVESAANRIAEIDRSIGVDPNNDPAYIQGLQSAARMRRRAQEILRGMA
jgi:hypothetical protein